MISDLDIRNQVRVTISGRPHPETYPETIILLALRKFFGEPIEPDQMLLALRWNEARGWAERVRNPDLERDEWRLTQGSKGGWKKEGL